MGKNIALVILSMLVFEFSGLTQSVKREVYKKVDTVELSLDIYYPEKMEAGLSCPAIVFFYGGGWIGGSITQFEPHARYFSEKGIVCFLVDYRVKTRQQTSPFESLRDAKSAMRYVRENAKKFHVDPARIAASGGSAGGHLAAATALIDKYNEESDDLSVSCIPDALILFNPVIDNGPGGYGYDRIGDEYKDFSPLHNINQGAPPTIFFLGTEDNLIPVETAEYYKVVMEKVKSRCDLFLYEGAGHGFFNQGREPDHYTETVQETEKFLISLGYIK